MAFKLHTPPEDGGQRIKGRAVIALLSVLVAVGAMVFLDGGETAVAKEALPPPAEAIPQGPVISLPSTYEELREEVKPDSPALLPLPQEEPSDENSEVIRLQRAEVINRERRRIAARTGEVFVPVRGDLGASSMTAAVPPSASSTGDATSFNVSYSAVGSGGANPRDDNGRQDDKRSFLGDTRASTVVLQNRLITPQSPYQVMAGTAIPGVLITGINSDLPGQILGQVSQNTFDSVTGRYLLVPQGTKVVGEYDSRIVYGQERVLIVWTRLIFPNGKSLSLEGMPGVDMSGFAGLSDKVNNHYLKLLSGVVVSSVLSAGSRVAQGGSRTVDPSLGQLGAEGFAMNVDDVGQQIARKNLNIQPTLEIEPGKRFSIFVNKDLVLEPYQG